MLHSNFRFVGFGNEDRLILAGQRELLSIQTHAPTLIPLSVACHEASSLKWESVKAIELRLQEEEFEKCLSHLKSARKLEFLSFPIALLSRLVDLLPLPTLETLIISGDGKGKIDTSVCVPSLIRLQSIPAILQFSVSSFPNLQHLHAADGRPGRIRNLVRNFKNLKSLSLIKTNRVESFEDLPENIEYLRLINGSLKNLEGIQSLKSLTDLDLQNLPNLNSIKPLTGCPILREIQIGYCNHISDLEIIASFKNLERLLIFGSKIDKPKFLELIKNRSSKLKECIING